MASVFEQLEVNVASVVIGALMFIIAIAWIDGFRAITDKVYFDDGQEGRRYTHQVRKKLVSALTTTILAVVGIIIVYSIYAKTDGFKADTSDGLNSFPGIIDIPYDYADSASSRLGGTSIMR
jgi:formate hydrogenlyase subunit 3/multisubunit Na+/H+ antiporter MnhD subunit